MLSQMGTLECQKDSLLQPSFPAPSCQSLYSFVCLCLFSEQRFSHRVLKFVHLFRSVIQLMCRLATGGPPKNAKLKAAMAWQ